MVFRLRTEQIEYERFSSVFDLRFFCLTLDSRTRTTNVAMLTRLLIRSRRSFSLATQRYSRHYRVVLITTLVYNTADAMVFNEIAETFARI